MPTCDTLYLCRALATDAAVLVIPGIAFGSLGEGFVRISFAATVEEIGTGIERMGRYLRDLERERLRPQPPDVSSGGER